MAGKITSVDGYIATLPPDVQSIAETVRTAIRLAAPTSVEAIRYGMPAFQVDGATVIYFAVWKKHVGLYPIYAGTPLFEREIGPYRAEKDSVRFPLNQPLPLHLIGSIVESQLARLGTAGLIASEE